MDAVAWSKEISGYVGKKYNITVDTWLDAVGPINTIRWTVDYGDIAAFDKTMSAVLVDPDYWRFIEKSTKSDLFIEGSGVDTLSKKL
jgi:hypothetical protein